MITLVPAYGRTYSSKDAAMKDWVDGKDFKIWQGPYTSVRDKFFLIEQFGGIQILFNRTHAPISIKPE